MLKLYHVGQEARSILDEIRCSNPEAKTQCQSSLNTRLKSETWCTALPRQVLGHSRRSQIFLACPLRKLTKFTRPFAFRIALEACKATTTRTSKSIHELPFALISPRLVPAVTSMASVLRLLGQYGVLGFRVAFGYTCFRTRRLAATEYIGTLPTPTPPPMLHPPLLSSRTRFWAPWF